MKRHPEDIVSHAKRGIPSTLTNDSNGHWVSAKVDYPDSWFHELHGYQPKTGRKYGNTYLSREGFTALEHDLKAAFLAGDAVGVNPWRHDVTTWDQFVALINEHYLEVEKQRQKMIKSHQKVIDELLAFNL